VLVAVVVAATIFGVLCVADRCTTGTTGCGPDQGTFTGMAGLIANDRAGGSTTKGTDHGTALGIRTGGAGAAGGKADGKSDESKGLLHGSIGSDYLRLLPLECSLSKAECGDGVDGRLGNFIHKSKVSSARTHSRTSLGPW